jgi:hypothetical protein
MTLLSAIRSGQCALEIRGVVDAPDTSPLSDLRIGTQRPLHSLEVEELDRRPNQASEQDLSRSVDPAGGRGDSGISFSRRSKRSGRPP